MEEKTCSRCGESKPLDQFYKDKKSSDGHTNDCKECRRAYVRERRNKAKIEEVKVENPCAVCGRNATIFRVWVDEGSIVSTCLCASCERLSDQGAIALNYRKLPMLRLREMNG